MGVGTIQHRSTLHPLSVVNVPFVLELLGVPPQTFKREYFIGGDDQPTIVRQLVPVEERRKEKEERRKKKKKKVTPKRIPKNSKSNQLQLVDVDTTE